MTAHLAVQVADTSAEQETVRCPKCSKKLLFNPTFSGDFCCCPECWHKFQMPVTELAMLLQIRNYTKATRFWVRLIFWFVALPFLWFIFWVLR